MVKKDGLKLLKIAGFEERFNCSGGKFRESIIGRCKYSEGAFSFQSIYKSGGLHSGETGPSEMLMELAYRLAVEDSPLVNTIRDNLIVSILPVLEPDGRDRYVDWYYRHLVDIDTERGRITGPPYWGKYIFHDNNRDINHSQVTMRAVLDWYLQWHPPIMHDLHESVPFLYTFSGQAPQNPSLDPILFGELPWFANFEMAQMTRYGMPGVWTHGFVDMWSPGYLAFMSSNHNGLVRMYETYGNGGATTMKRVVASGAGPGQTSREWYRPNPPYREVTWSMRNSLAYRKCARSTPRKYRYPCCRSRVGCSGRKSQYCPLVKKLSGGAPPLTPCAATTSVLTEPAILTASRGSTYLCSLAS